MRGAIRLLNTLLVAAVTTKPAVALAGFVPDWTVVLVCQSDGRAFPERGP
jgi:hypothetical protein